jgi:hydroxypyruvate reductase
MELALAAAQLLANSRGSLLLSAGTDGSDGPTDAAGAFADSGTLCRAALAGLDHQAALRRHDSYHFFHALGDLLVTGPTMTNVQDLQILLREPPHAGIKKLLD